MKDRNTVIKINLHSRPFPSVTLAPKLIKSASMSLHFTFESIGVWNMASSVCVCFFLMIV